MGRAQAGNNKFLDPGIAIALKVIGSDWLAGIRHRQLDVGTLAAISLEQLLDAPDFGRRFVGRQVEPDPPVAIFSHAPQRRPTLAAEEDWQSCAADRLGVS